MQYWANEIEQPLYFTAKEKVYGEENEAPWPERSMPQALVLVLVLVLAN